MEVDFVAVDRPVDTHPVLDRAIQTPDRNHEGRSIKDPKNRSPPSNQVCLFDIGMKLEDDGDESEKEKDLQEEAGFDERTANLDLCRVVVVDDLAYACAHEHFAETVGCYEGGHDTAGVHGSLAGDIMPT